MVLTLELLISSWRYRYIYLSILLSLSLNWRWAHWFVDHKIIFFHYTQPCTQSCQNQPVLKLQNVAPKTCAQNSHVQYSFRPLFPNNKWIVLFVGFFKISRIMVIQGLDRKMIAIQCAPIYCASHPECAISFQRFVGIQHLFTEIIATRIRLPILRIQYGTIVPMMSENRAAK